MIRIDNIKNFGNKRYLTEDDLNGVAFESTVSSLVQSSINDAVTSASVTIDSAITSNGTNPVQGKAIHSALLSKVDKIDGKGLSTEDFTTEFKTKLQNVESGAEANEDSYKTIAVKQQSTTTNIVADSTTATVTFVAGDNVVLNANATSRTIAISATDTTYDVATSSSNGLMGSAMVVKLDGIASGAEANQNAFATVTVGSGNEMTSIEADAKQDTLAFVAGAGVSISGDATNNTITIQVVIDSSITSDGSLPVAGSAIYGAMDGMVVSSSLSNVAFTGLYSDLQDAPSAFIPPSEKIQFTSANSQKVTWSNYVATFTHSLNCYPIVTVYDENNEQVYPIVTILSGTSFSLDFNTDSNPVGANTWTCVVVYGTGYGNAEPGDGVAMSFIPYENGNTTIGGSYRQEITTIPASTTEYSLLEGTYHHVPNSTPTYTLPNVTDTSITHEVMLTVKFTSNVLSYQFRNYSGTQITPSSTPEIQANSVVTFRCTYENLLGNWAVLPVPLGTAS